MSLDQADKFPNAEFIAFSFLFSSHPGLGSLTCTSRYLLPNIMVSSMCNRQKLELFILKK